MRALFVRSFRAVWNYKKYWLTPTIVTFIIVGLIVIADRNADIIPFFYRLF